MFDENFIKVTSYEVLGRLPDPFLRADGTRISDPAQWAEQRKLLYKSAVELQYGVMPPEPEFLEVEMLYDCSGKHNQNTYRIVTGRRESPVSFTMRLFMPAGAENPPVAVDGDMCFPYAFDKEYLGAFLDNGIAFALFNRTELAHDVKFEGRRKGQLYGAYPEYSFGALGAWAWGYSRVVDALEKLGRTDMSCVAFVGHSRGAKTAMLAGACDERAAIVNPNSTCAGGCGCYRIHMRAINEDGVEKPSETLADIWKNFGYWFGPDLGEYAERENELPFDSHFLKALVAPRIFLDTEAASDIWANPIGSWMTTRAAEEVYKFLGVPQNILWKFRTGYHYHKIEDVMTLVSVIKHKSEGTPLPDGLFKTPFRQPELIFDWRAPDDAAAEPVADGVYKE